MQRCEFPGMHSKIESLFAVLFSISRGRDRVGFNDCQERNIFADGPEMDSTRIPWDSGTERRRRQLCKIRSEGPSDRKTSFRGNFSFAVDNQINSGRGTQSPMTFHLPFRLLFQEIVREYWMEVYNHARSDIFITSNNYASDIRWY